MKKLPALWITFEPKIEATPGAHIADVVEELCSFARQTQKLATVSFNGIKLTAAPGDSHEKVYAIWAAGGKAKK